MGLSIETGVEGSTAFLAGFCSVTTRVFLGALRVRFRLLDGAAVSVSWVWVILRIPK